MGNDISDMEDMNYPADVVGVAKKIHAPYAPKAPGGTQLPASPLTPAADLTYDPKTKKWGKP